MKKALIFSPPSRCPVKKKIVVEDPPDIVVLAPFTKTPRLVFNDVKIGCTANASLVIENPTNCDLQVWINQSKVQLEVSWKTIVIKAYSKEELSVSWTPTEVFSGCSILKIQAENGMKKDISVILKSLTNITKKKAALNGSVKKALVNSQQSSKIRKVLQATQKSICTEIASFSKPKQFITSNIETNKKYKMNYENKENIKCHTKELNFCDALDSSEFSLSHTSPIIKFNISSTPNVDSIKSVLENFSGNTEFTPLKNNSNLVANNRDNTLESSYLNKIDSLCFTPIHSSSVYKKNYNESEGYNNTLSVNYNNGFVKDLHSGRMSSPLHDVSLESIPKEIIEPKNITYQLNSSVVSSGTYKIGVSPEIHDDIIAIDEFLINNKKKSVDHSKQNISKKSSKIKITYSKTSSHCIIKDLDLSNDKTIDPFILSTMFYDEQYFEQQVLHIQKWLNALLKPPSELSCTAEEKINLGKLWNDVKNKPLVLPQSKEIVSNKLHVNHRLQSLRSAARKLFREADMVLVFVKCTKLVENEVLSIRNDRQIHLDVALQKYVMQLFLCYNPLWLRIGLETVCNEQIHLASNSDIHGLSSFIYNRLFKGQNVTGKQNNIYKQEFAQRLKKFILKKFLMLVFFLDRAKKVKLIAHDPCLFAKAAHVKESRDMLFNFAKELIAGIGDITRPLKTIGYIVTHKQSYLDEFDFAVKNLAIDIRDGIRLAKIMEIILLRKDLVCNLRAPAISRLQKIFNVTISFTALQESGFTVHGDISPRDITDGYKEKTLSFFWQLIYKFQAPLFVKAITTIQVWWRSEPICLKRNKLKRQRMLFEVSATFIQSAWRGYKARIEYKVLHFKSNRAARIIQREWKIYKERLANESYKQNKAAIKIQKAFRSYMFIKQLRVYIKTNINYIIYIQRYIRAMHQMKAIHNYYIKLRNCTIFIQRLYRAKLSMGLELKKYQNLRKSVIFIQRYFRNRLCTRLVRNEFLLLKASAIVIQRRFRALKSMRFAKIKYQSMQTSAIIIQSRYKAFKAMEKDRLAYLKLQSATILIQQKFRAQILMRHDRLIYTKLREVTVYVQRKFRAKQKMLLARNCYLVLKQSVLVIQKYYKAHKAMQVDRSNYLHLKYCAILLQTKFRAKLAMRVALNKYQLMKKSAIVIQRRYRAIKIMQKIRNDYNILQKTAKFVQNHYRAQKAMKIARNEYLKQRDAAIILQTRYRANLVARKDFIYYTQLKQTVVFVQREFRAKKNMHFVREKYLALRQAVVFVQNKFRAKLEARKARLYYQNLKQYVILIQRRFRIRCMLKKAMSEYKLLKSSAIVIQTRFRAHRAMIKDRQAFTLLLKNTLFIQRKYRAKKAMEICRNDYIQNRNLIIKLQQNFRATLLMRKIQSEYTILRKSAIVIQRKFRAYNLMRLERENYLLLKQNVKYIQIKFRALLAMKACYIRFNLLKKYTIFIQRQYRANCFTKIIKQEYNHLRNATIMIQRRYKANQARNICRNRYLLLKEKVIIIQRLWRGQLAMKKELRRYNIIKNAVVRMQHIFRSTHVLIYSNDPKARRVISISVIIKLQAWWRANRVRRKLSPKLKTILNRLQHPPKIYKQISIKDKTYEIIQNMIMKGVHSVAELDSLAFSSRIYPHLSETHSTIITKCLYITIINNNRSVPELNIALRCSEILLNFVKYSETFQSVLWVELIPELLTSASRFCDKEHELFCNILTILWIFGQHAKTKFIVKRVLQKNDCKKILQLISKKITRLDHMQNNARKNKSVKHEMHLPLIEPDYGLPRKNPRSFTNSKFGLQCVLQTFSISID